MQRTINVPPPLDAELQELARVHTGGDVPRLIVQLISQAVEPQAFEARNVESTMLKGDG